MLGPRASLTKRAAQTAWSVIEMLGATFANFSERDTTHVLGHLHVAVSKVPRPRSVRLHHS